MGKAGRPPTVVDDQARDALELTYRQGIAARIGWSDEEERREAFLFLRQARAHAARTGRVLVIDPRRGAEILAAGGYTVLLRDKQRQGKAQVTGE